MKIVRIRKYHSSPSKGRFEKEIDFHLDFHPTLDHLQLLLFEYFYTTEIIIRDDLKISWVQLTSNFENRTNICLGYQAFEAMVSTLSYGNKLSTISTAPTHNKYLVEVFSVLTENDFKPFLTSPLASVRESARKIVYNNEVKDDEKS